MLTPQSFFDVSVYAHQGLFAGAEHAWQPLHNLKQYMDEQQYPVLDRILVPEGVPLPRSVVVVNGEVVSAEGLDIRFGDATKGGLTVSRDGVELAGASVIMAGAVLLGDRIRLGRGSLVEAGALIKSPAIIGDWTEVRHTAYLRGYTLVGNRCVVGHTTEVKHTIFLDDAKAGHFAYLGDSILGNNVNLGAGTKLANLRFIEGEVGVRAGGQTISTGLRKLGAIMGDQVQTGCNSVTNPGTLLGKKSMVLPNTTVPPGYSPDNSIIR